MQNIINMAKKVLLNVQITAWVKHLIVCQIRFKVRIIFLQRVFSDTGYLADVSEK